MKSETRRHFHWYKIIQFTFIFFQASQVTMLSTLLPQASVDIKYGGFTSHSLPNTYTQDALSELTKIDCDKPESLWSSGVQMSGGHFQYFPSTLLVSLLTNKISENCLRKMDSHAEVRTEQSSPPERENIFQDQIVLTIPEHV